MTVKANALFFVFYALVSLLSFSRLAAGLKSLKFSESLIVILLFCARGIDIFESEYRRMKEAAKLRGFEMKEISGPIKPWQRLLHFCSFEQFGGAVFSTMR